MCRKKVANVGVPVLRCQVAAAVSWREASKTAPARSILRVAVIARMRQWSHRIHAYAFLCDAAFFV